MKTLRVLAVCGLVAAGMALGFETHAEDKPAATQPAASQPATIKPDEAKNYMDKDVVVEGKVTSTRRTDKSCFINFSREKGAFYVIIFEPALSNAKEAPEKKYDGQVIQVKGKVSEYKGRPQIIVKSLDQITIIEKK